MHAVIAEQMRVRLDRAEIVDGDEFQVLPPRLAGGAQHQPSDAAESVDRDLHGHISVPSLYRIRLEFAWHRCQFMSTPASP